MLGRPRQGNRGDSSYDVDRRKQRDRRSGRFAPGGGAAFDHGVRIIWIWIAIAIVWVVGHLIWYQLITSADLSHQAQARRTNVIALTARRGTIYDRNGNVLAISKSCKDIYCNPDEVQDPPAIASVLAEHLGGKAADYLDELSSNTTFAYISRKTDEEVADAIKADLIARDLVGVYYLQNSKRTYPYGAAAGQILGIVGTDGDGLSGLEQRYNDILRGEDGQMIMEVGATGTPIAGAVAEVSDAKNGTDLVISIDIDVQQVAESAIEEAVKDYQADSGSVMVTDPRTGEVLAACSTPLLDITDLSSITDDQLTLKPVVASFEPGSIFKVLTAAIGIEEGSLTTTTTLSVPPEVEVGDDIVHDDDGRDYTMNMDLREMMRRSSNCGLSLVAQRLIGATSFARGVEDFGIGSTTGIDFPGESNGIVRKLDEYDGSTLGSMAFGQGLAVPMVQMVKAVGAIANGGTLETPHLVTQRGGTTETWPEGKRIISEETASAVTDMMCTVVAEGTAENAQVPGYEVAGKTGTGEQADESGGYKANCFVSSLIGFAPASKPEVLVYVGLNGTPYLASGSAALTFSTIMGEALKSLNVQPTD